MTVAQLMILKAHFSLIDEQIRREPMWGHKGRDAQVTALVQRSAREMSHYLLSKVWGHMFPFPSETV